MTREELVAHPHWRGLLSRRDTSPTAESVERARRNGFTKYAFEAVAPAFADLCDANDAAVQAYAEACEYVHAHTTEEDRRYPAWERFAEGGVKEVLNAQFRWFDGTCLNLGIQYSHARYGKEFFPLSRWATLAKRLRRAAKELSKVVAAQTALTTNGA